MNSQGDLLKVPFDFIVNGKKVWGWAGVLANGSRADAGFSIIQANRVIKGWPESYRPTTLFGDQEGGSNDLVNQRLVGELFLRILKSAIPRMRFCSLMMRLRKSKISCLLD